jgi:L-alanine-DL-glutamate epimerase-like enolase superfamily enzyme
MLFAKLGLSAIADEAREKRTRVVEDPILRHDFEGLRKLRHAVNWTQINSGEYLDLAGKLILLDNHGADILNVHGR